MDSAFYTTLIVDERLAEARYGPSPQGTFATIDRFTEAEWAALVAIASHPLGASERDPVARAHGKAVVNRKIVNRLRERFRAHTEIPREYTVENAVIDNRWGQATYYLNRRITAHIIPGRIVGPGEHAEARTLDLIIPAMEKAAVELFGARALAELHDCLPDDVRRYTVGAHYPGRWIPTRFVTAWMKTLREGPARMSTPDFHQFLRRMESYRVVPGFARYHRSARQHRLSDIRDAWKTCYDSGDIQATLSPRDDWIELRIWNHPYCSSPTARETHAVCWLAIAEELGARDCRLVAHDLEDLTGAFRIRIEGDLLPVLS